MALFEHKCATLTVHLLYYKILTHNNIASEKRKPRAILSAVQEGQETNIFIANRT